jgi:SAM-dependent methyltransferase
MKLSCTDQLGESEHRSSRICIVLWISTLSAFTHIAYSAGTGLLFAQADEKVDLVCCLNGTFSHMHTNADARDCFRAAHNALKPGGLLVVELNHPSCLFDGGLISSGDTWEIENEDCQAEIWCGTCRLCSSPSF